ncbi:MAG: hypothetical protein SVK08_04965, partial [Halobacteriota archaeon]|nr:hypothetical protein [Halobacteriota archaeon]
GAGLQEGQVFRRATLERLELEILRSSICNPYSEAVTEASKRIMIRMIETAIDFGLSVDLDLSISHLATVRILLIIIST